MDMLTEFSINPASGSAGLADLGHADLSGDVAALGLSFLTPVAPREKEDAKRASGTGLSIERIGQSAYLQIHDSRLFAPGRQAFCRALLEAAVKHGAFTRGEICLETATCRLEFDPKRLDRVEVSAHASAAIRAAIPLLEASGRDLWRGAPPCASFSAFAGAEDARSSIWETRACSPTRLRLRNQGSFSHDTAIGAAGLLRTWPGVVASNCVPAMAAYELDVEFDPDFLTTADVVLAAEAALRVARDCIDNDAWLDPNPFGSAPDGLTRGISWDMVVAGGSMLLAVAGLVLPGIPSVPFFVLSCHSLCRTYPQLQPWLHSIPGVGPLLRASTGIESKWSDPNFVAKTLILGGLAAAFFLAIHPPFPLVLACELGMMFFSIH